MSDEDVAVLTALPEILRTRPELAPILGSASNPEADLEAQAELLKQLRHTCRIMEFRGDQLI